MKQKPYNRLKEISKYQEKFKVPFEMKDDAIDTRTMADNYKDGIIPLSDIAEAIDIVLGPSKRPKNRDPFDPVTGVVKFAYVTWKELFLWPKFQRDIAPNHLYKIEQDFDPTCVIVPTAIKINGKYMMWDGHHTAHVCHRQNWTVFPIWYIDVDLIKEEDIPEEFVTKVEYGVWLAGQNMIRINSRNKRKLHAYDEFMILLETKDTFTIQMYNILTAAGFTPKRSANTNNAFSQIKSGQAIFDMADEYGSKGKYFKRALQFHKRTWDLAPAELEVWRPMALLYKEAEIQGFVLDKQFDLELGKLFVKLYGDPNTVQQSLKDEYYNELHTNGFKEPRDHDQWRVYDAIINLYNKKIKRIQLPTAQCRW